MPEGKMELNPIGSIKRENESVKLQIDEKYRPALKNLDKFSHVLVLWWADKHDNEESRNHLQTDPPYAEGHTMGVFATRAEYRPNPVSVSTTKILEVNEEQGKVSIDNIDAFDGTPLLDLKAYFPVVDRVESPVIPEWLEGWPEWIPEGGIGLDI